MNLKKVCLIAAIIGLAIIVSGCTGGQDITPVFKALPEVQQFMKEHPNAKITVTYWSKEEVAQSSQEISQQCDKPIKPVAMYKATVSEGDLKIVSWINAENQIVICSVTEGQKTTTPITTITPTPIVTPVIATATGTASPTVAAPGKFRVGPSVTLRPVIDVIDTNQDGIAELFMNNPSLNDVTLNVDARVSVPSGIHVYGQSFGQAAGAGVVAGTFSVPSGTSRTIIVVVKADKSARLGSHTLSFTGLYWPDDNKDNFQPISLTYPVTVKEASKNPESAEPSTPTPTITTITPGVTPVPIGGTPGITPFITPTYLGNKSLITGESWDMGRYVLTAVSIDAKSTPKQVRLILSKDGYKVDDRIFSVGQTFNWNNIFITKIYDIFTGATSDLVKLRDSYLYDKIIVSTPTVPVGVTPSVTPGVTVGITPFITPTPTPVPMTTMMITSWSNSQTNDNALIVNIPQNKVVRFYAITNNIINSTSVSCGGGTLVDSGYYTVHHNYIDCKFPTLVTTLVSITASDVNQISASKVWSVTSYV